MKALLAAIVVAGVVQAGLHAWLETRDVAHVLLADPAGDPVALFGLGALFLTRLALFAVAPAALVGWLVFVACSEQVNR